MVKIILLGRCCRISLDTLDINLKSETSLFEWTWTDTFNEINIIIQKIINNEELLTYRMNGNDYIKDTNIKTCHYINKNYSEILTRRKNRFVNDIKNESEVLFIRDDLLGTITFDEIKQFFYLIKYINPLLSFKMLLLSDANKFSKILYPNLHHNIYNKKMYKQYINDCYEIKESFVNKKNKDISDDEL
jgi:hypothetical protein